MPLRIAVEHAACAVLGASAAACLEDAESGIVVVLGESGVVALAPPGAAPPSWRGPLPRFGVSREENDGMVWWSLSNDAQPCRLTRPPSRHELAIGGVMSVELASLVIRATHKVITLSFIPGHTPNHVALLGAPCV